MNKQLIRDTCIKDWFFERLKQVIGEYRELIRGTKQSQQVVSYRNQTFNILQLSKPSTQIFIVNPESSHAKVLDKYIRINNELDKVTAYLTFILNFCDESYEFDFLVHEDKSSIDHIPVLRQADLASFKEANIDKFRFIKRLELMKDI